MKIYALKRKSVPKIAVLATGLAAAILMATVSPQAAQATPDKQTECTGCHGPVGDPARLQTVFLGPTTMAPSADYAVTFNMNALVNTGASGWWVANSDAIGGTGPAATVCRDAWGVNPPIAPNCYGGPALSQSFTARMTAPATPGVYWYKVFMVHGVPSAQETYTKTFFITVIGPAVTTTTPPVSTTTPPVTTTTPPVTTTTPPVTTTTPPVTTTTPPVTTTTLPVTTTTLPPITRPGAPTGVTATPGDGQAVVSWTPSTSGDPATTYTVTSSPGGMSVTTTGDTATLTGLTNGTSYTFTVTATNSAGTVVSDASATVIPSAVSAAVDPTVVAAVPLGSPATGAGGAAQSNDGALLGLGGLALLLGGAAMVPAIRRRRQA